MNKQENKKDIHIIKNRILIRFIILVGAISGGILGLFINPIFITFPVVGIAIGGILNIKLMRKDIAQNKGHTRNYMTGDYMIEGMTFGIIIGILFDVFAENDLGLSYVIGTEHVLGGGYIIGMVLGMILGLMIPKKEN